MILHRSPFSLCFIVAIVTSLSACKFNKNAASEVNETANQKDSFSSTLKVSNEPTVVFHWTNNPNVKDAASAFEYLKASAASAKDANRLANGEKMYKEVAYYGYGLYTAGDPYHARIINFDTTYRTLITFTLKGNFEALRINDAPMFGTPDFSYVNKISDLIKKPTTGVHYEYVVRKGNKIPTKSAFVLHDPSFIDPDGIAVLDTTQLPIPWKDIAFPNDCTSSASTGRCLGAFGSHFVHFADDYFLQLKDKSVAFKNGSKNIPSEDAMVAALRSEYISSDKGRKAFDALTAEEKNAILGGSYEFLNQALFQIVSEWDKGIYKVSPAELKTLTSLFFNGGDLPSKTAESAEDLRAQLGKNFEKNSKAVVQLGHVLSYLTWLDDNLRNGRTLDSWL